MTRKDFGAITAAMFRFAHLSDPHLPLPAVGAAQLASKRVTGYLSWTRKRRHLHVPRALAAVVADIKRLAPDHVALTGDIANISLPAEFAQAADWLRGFGPPDWITVVPGNHDLYVPVPWSETLAQWGPYMAADGADPPASNDDFPILRRRGPVAFVGLSTAVPMPTFIAAGRLGEGQIARAEALLARLGEEGACRVVLIHHPPQAGGAPWRKALRDASAFRATLGRVGAEMVLHGHNHRSEIARIDGPSGPIPVLGAASASAALESPYGRAKHHLVAVARAGAGWRFEVEVRELDDESQGCRRGTVYQFAVAGAPPVRRAA